MGMHHGSTYLRTSPDRYRCYYCGFECLEGPHWTHPQCQAAHAINPQEEPIPQDLMTKYARYMASRATQGPGAVIAMTLQTDDTSASDPPDHPVTLQQYIDSIMASTDDTSASTDDT